MQKKKKKLSRKISAYMHKVFLEGHKRNLCGCLWRGKWVWKGRKLAFYYVSFEVLELLFRLCIKSITKK